MTSNANKYKDQKPGPRGLVSANNRQEFEIRLDILLFMSTKNMFSYEKALGI